MSGVTAGEVKELTESLAQLIVVVGRLADPVPFNENTSAATVNINAGGIGVWLAVTGCLVMLAMNIALLAFFMRTDREVSEQGHQLNAIYILAPHLKPKETPK